MMFIYVYGQDAVEWTQGPRWHIFGPSDFWDLRCEHQHLVPCGYAWGLEVIPCHPMGVPSSGETTMPSDSTAAGASPPSASKLFSQQPNVRKAQGKLPIGHPLASTASEFHTGYKYIYIWIQMELIPVSWRKKAMVPVGSTLKNPQQISSQLPGNQPQFQGLYNDSLADLYPHWHWMAKAGDMLPPLASPCLESCANSYGLFIQSSVCMSICTKASKYY